jgi:hypothetical protein
VRRIRVSLVSAAVVVAALVGAGAASASPILLPTTAKQLQKEAAIHAADAQYLNPPAPPCPESGQLPPPFSNCGAPETPATSLPYMGNMAYWGGHVQTDPKEYLVLWGWGESGAFPGQTCSPETISEPGVSSATLACDPDGAGKYMADFLSQVGGTGWANVSTQYYQTDSSGNQQYITNPSNVLAGIWVDDTNDITGLAKTSSTAPAGSGNTYYDLAQEAERAAAHFGVSGAALQNANFIIAQPPAYSDPNALSTGYCAFHDWTDPNSPGNSYYKGISTELSYTNIPYQLAINSGGTNVCGKDAVNPAPQGNLDGFSIVLGHEMEETITDPGAEDIDSTGPTGTQTYEGGWYDPFDANENGDKCAWVGENLLTAQGPPEPIYGALGDITGNAGSTFAVQSLWSNAADEGTGYCAGAGTDSPVPSAAYGSSSSSSGGSSSGSASTSNSSSGSGSPATTSSTANPSAQSTGASTSAKAGTAKKTKQATSHKKRKRRVRKHRKRRRRKHKK